MRNLMVLLFLLSFGTSAHAETLDERIEKFLGELENCVGVSLSHCFLRLQQAHR